MNRRLRRWRPRRTYRLFLKWIKQAAPVSVSRRRFVGFAGAATGSWAVSRCAAATCLSSELGTQRVLRQKDRVTLTEPAEEIIERAYQLGCKYEKEQGGCARCTVAALQDALPLLVKDEGLFRAASCLDGGATPVAVQNCGAFTGAGMVIGYVCGSRRDDGFHGDAKLAHRLLHQVYDRFAEDYQTVLCRDVKEAAGRDCPEVVGRSARWVAEVLLAEFAPDDRSRGRHGDGANS